VVGAGGCRCRGKSAGNTVPFSLYLNYLINFFKQKIRKEERIFSEKGLNLV
jgi:hypothetical protein